jgi:hypothetical protein
MIQRHAKAAGIETKLYDRRRDEISPDEIERIAI